MADEKKEEKKEARILKIGDHPLNYFRRFVNEDKSGLDFAKVKAAGFNQAQIGRVKKGVEQAGWFKKTEEERTVLVEQGTTELDSSRMPQMPPAPGEGELGPRRLAEGEMLEAAPLPEGSMVAEVGSAPAPKPKV